MTISRRDFMRGVAGASGAAVAGSLISRDASAALPPPPKPDLSGIDHIVVVMMENRSFDHMLGWLPGANGRQAVLRYPDASGKLQPTYRLTSFTGCPHPDPDHTYDGGRSEMNGGKMNGWLRTTTNDSYCIGYYTEPDLPFFSGLARNFTTLDRFFCSILGPTLPNRVFSHAAQTDRLKNSTDIATVPTIWDLLATAGVSHRYYSIRTSHS
jgi:phospholipase C